MIKHTRNYAGNPFEDSGYLFREEHEAEGLCCSCRKFLLQEWAELLRGHKDTGGAVLWCWGALQAEQHSQGDGANPPALGVMAESCSVHMLLKPFQTEAALHHIVNLPFVLIPSVALRV